jgi:hypothetical protein
MTRFKYLTDVDSPSHLAGKVGEERDFTDDYFAQRLVKAGYGYAIPLEKEPDAPDTRADPQEARPSPRTR